MKGGAGQRKMVSLPLGSWIYAQLNAFFFLAQRSCVLDYMCRNDAQGIEDFLLLGILLDLVTNCI